MKQDLPIDGLSVFLNVNNITEEVDINRFLNTANIKEIRLYKGKGCSHCNNSGYAGRIGIFEVLDIDDDVRELISNRANADTIKQKAIENGMSTMMEDGLKKAIAGKTTLEEIFRVTKQ